MIPEAELEQTRAGLVPTSPGWFVMNARTHAGSIAGRPAAPVGD